MLKGKELIQLLAQQTGLPQDLIESELVSMLQRNGKTKESATLDDIRELLIDYLQEVILKAKDKNDERALTSTQ